MGYLDGVRKIAEKLQIKSGKILVTGATGLIGSCIIDVLREEKNSGADIEIYGMSRSEERLLNRFPSDVVPVIQDVTNPLPDNTDFDYIFHLASNADPRSYALHPVDTIMTNIKGTENILEYCTKHKETKMLMASTFEVYGHIEGVSEYSEEMSGIIDQTVLRNGYPESKRCCELLLRSYVEEHSIQAVIARLPSVYGPTMLKSDSKAHAQFIHKALKNENIVLKSKGEQIRSYCYVLDAVDALFKILTDGNSGEIYNVSNENSIASIAEVASACASIAGVDVVYELPDEIEAKGFSRSRNCILVNDKLKSLGWQGTYTLEEGLKDTIEYLKEVENA